MDENHYQMIGLIGFIVAGLIFVAVGVKHGDMLTIVGSLVWIASCVIWMVPIIKSKDN